MSYCLNPSCEKPASNLPQNRFCQRCGSKLLLKDRYRALQIIGQGGFGKTFLAWDEGLANHPHCVTKQFFLQGQSPQITQKAIALFQEEAKRLEKLGHHPQVPTFYDYLEQNNQFYIIQEFIEGKTLAEELEQQGVFTEQKIRSLLLDLLPVLQFIHQGQVIHRDIKPDNIIRRQADKKLVLVDFGAAKEVTKTALMKTGTIIGSEGYTAPEQAHGKAVFTSDIFSLGVTCIYLLTRVEPSQLYDPIENQFVWRNKIIHPVSLKFLDIIEKMTQPLVKQRFQTATEILTALNFPSSKGSNTAPTLIVRSTQQTIIQGLTDLSKGQKGIIAGVIAGSGLLGWQLFLSPSIFKSSVPLAKIPETTKPLAVPSVIPSPPPIIKASPAPSIQPPPISVQSSPEIVQKAKPSQLNHSSDSGSSHPKRVTLPKRIAKRSPSRTEVSSRPNGVPSQTKTRYTTPSNSAYTVYKPRKKTKVALSKKRSTPPSQTAALEQTLKSGMSSRRKKPASIARRSNVSPSVPEPWATKSVPNPASELEETLRNGQ